MNGKKLAAAVLAALFIMAGCSSGDTSWVYAHEDVRLPAGVYILQQVSQTAKAEGKLNEAATEAGETYEGLPIKELMKREIEGQSVQDWIEQQTLRQVQQYFAVEQKYAENGLAIQDTDKQVIDNNAATSYQASQEFYENNGVSQQSLALFYQNQIKKEKLFETLYQGEGEFAVPEEELKNIFREQYVKVEYMLFPLQTAAPEGGEKTIEEINEEIKKQAESFKQRLEDGEAVEDLAFERMQQTVPEDQKEEITKPEPGSQTLLLSEDTAMYYGEAFNKAALAASVGDVNLIEDNGVYYLFRRIDIMENPQDFENTKFTILRKEKFGEYENRLTEWGLQLELKANEAALKRYTPDKLKIETVETSKSK